MRPLLVAVLGVAIFVSGCTADAAPKALVENKAAEPAVVKLPAGASAIEGYVIDDEMAPIAGAEVSVLGLPLVALTRDDGRFFLGPVTPGAHEVTARHEGYGDRSRSFTTQPDETLLVAMVLRTVPLAQPYTAVVSQKGMVGCSAAAAVQPGVGATLLASDVYQDCGLRTVGVATNNQPLNTQLDDRSSLAWSAENPANWETAALEVRWTHGSPLAQHLAASLAGPCGSKPVTLLSGFGASPLKLARAAPGVNSFIRDADTNGCTGQASCDPNGCSLTSAIRAAPSSQGAAGAGAGLALQQSFEATLTLGYLG